MGSSKYGKLAPTWLYRGEEKELFETQVEVDAAWNEGWSDDPDNKPEEPVIVQEPTWREIIKSVEFAGTLDSLEIFRKAEESREKPRKAVLDAIEEREKILLDEDTE